MNLKCCAATAIMLSSISYAHAAEQLVEPAAVAALEQMGQALSGLESFHLSAETEMEVVLDSDQKLTIGGKIMYDVRRPDGLRVALDTDVLQREFYYDGQTAIYVSPDQGYYAVIPEAPDSIHELLELASQKYGLNFPAADLFIWGTEHEPVDQITEGFLVGPATIAGQSVNHWAYRTESQDWEVWLQAEGDPLPLRISYVDRTDPALPRFSATYEWTPEATIDADSFAYMPSDDMQLIEFAQSDLAATANEGEDE
ncbi:DUF2092 domain-containing protein [Paracoccus sp. Z330]|uniref:DUF2092 domain-containing protein n=1 Tax=Paracoccus onchidii TaxID=3017813 RepID=A0ABT4ZHU8_9RHOB|nr:DUF2092 domain-containing protein [Paracoccus onchidii]MDB6178321.1 DUF2092 domain-containing protein [Paracoccus onchidii]